MDLIIEDLIDSRKQIYEILNKFGVCYIVTEDLKFNSKALELLREEIFWLDPI